MSKIYKSYYYFLLSLIVAFSYSVNAQNFKMIDINKVANSSPQNFQYSTNNTFVVYKGSFYFSADDGVHGKELFKSDGTSAGTQLVKDIEPGTTSSNITDIISSGSYFYFFVIDPNYRQTVWVSDGTAAGTNPVSNIAPGYGSPFFVVSTDVNGTPYFFYIYSDASGNHMELWKTDATGLAGVKVAALNGIPSQTAVVNGKLFFDCPDYFTGVGDELYVSDGTPAGTHIVEDINPNPYAGSNPAHLTSLNGSLYFTADDGTGNALWVSDGSGGGTHRVPNVNNIMISTISTYGNNPFAIVNSTLYFAGSLFDNNTSTSTGYELCSYDASNPSANIILVKDIAAGATTSSPDNITNISGNLFFSAAANGTDIQLWKSDGTAAGTVLVQNINQGLKHFYYDFHNLNGTLIFSYQNDSLGGELWKSDGTPEGTSLVRDISPGPVSSSPYYLTNYNGTLVFVATAGIAGTELWRTDGTNAGTYMIKDINTTSTDNSGPGGFVQAGKKVMFTAYDPLAQSNIYTTDGTVAGTKALESPVRTGYPFVTLKKEQYLIDFNGNLWKTNGTKAGTKQLPLPSFVKSDSIFILNFFVSDNAIYVYLFNFYTSVGQLWSTDGTPAGTYLLKSDFNSYFNLYPTAVGRTVYFTNVNSNSGSELWKSDGTPAGTVLVKTIGSYNYNPLANLYNYKGKLYFNAYTSSGAGPFLWTSDGTAAGTNVFNGFTVPQQPFAQAGGKLFFFADDNSGLYGTELYCTDGTQSGTYLVKDINPGPAPGYSIYGPFKPLISGDKILYFFADDGITGAELWKTDGTAAGTIFVKDIQPGGNPAYVTEAVNTHDRLFFVLFHDVLWQSDGSGPGTNPVADANLSGASNYMNLAVNGDNLYFSAYTYAAGQELYIGNIRFAFQDNNLTTTPATLSSAVGEMPAVHLKLGPDPAENILQLYVEGIKKTTSATVSIFSLSGALMKTVRSNDIGRLQQLDVSSLARGVYIIKVDDGSKVLFSRFVKL